MGSFAKLLLIMICLVPAMSFAQVNSFDHPHPGPQPGPQPYPGPQPHPGPGPQPGPMNCRAYDNGWEEHYGGHATCRECVHIHGSCTEVCTATVVECSAIGMDQWGRSVRVAASDRDQWGAERRVMDDCSYYYRLFNCRIERCNRRDEQYSRACR